MASSDLPVRIDAITQFLRGTDLSINLVETIVTPMIYVKEAPFFAFGQGTDGFD
jgi:hypothetical protein